MKKYMHFEGLRGIAAFIVFIAHFKPTFCTDINKNFLNNIGAGGIKEQAFLENFLSLLYEGTLPVFIFWLMSAYVILIKLFDVSRNSNNRYLIEASTKRYFRLAIPVFFSSLLCFILLKTNLIYNNELANYLGKGYQDGWLNLWYNFVPGTIHFLKTTIVEVFIPGNSNYNIALWTMNPELLGSFLCFGLFAVIGKNKQRFSLYITICIFLMIAGIRDTTYFYYVVFLIGIIWCDSINSTDDGIYLKEKIKNIFNARVTPIFLLLTGFGVTILSDTLFPIHKNLYFFFTFPVKAIGFTLLINNFEPIKKLFSIKPLTFMGKISFSFYLIHIPVMFSFGIYLFMYAGISSPYKILIIFFILTFVTIVLSYFFMKLVDKKAISISDRIGKYFANNQ